MIDGTDNKLTEIREQDEEHQAEERMAAGRAAG